MTTKEHFVTNIYISKFLHLENINIALSPDTRQHLLITGKNGTGKTSLLERIRGNFVAINQKRWLVSKKQATGDGITVEFNVDDDLDAEYAAGRFVTAYFGATRQTKISISSGVEDVKLSSTYNLYDDPAQLLVKYMVHLKTQQAYAMQENDNDVVNSIKDWFARFQLALRELLGDNSIKLEYDYKRYNFLIHQQGKQPFGFNELSDGYSSIIRIVADLILRMEQNWLLGGTISHYDIEGVALIDELETHLHIELQRKILPFLTSFFPRIQFIVTTHSPYILTSIPNAVIYDLEKHVTFTDMTNFSVDDVAEAFFDADDYSVKMGNMLERYKELFAKQNLTEAEMIEKTELAHEFKNVPGKLASRIQSEFASIEG